jgi:hypothetical protein
VIIDLTGTNKKVTWEKAFLERMDTFAKPINTNGGEVGGDE